LAESTGEATPFHSPQRTEKSSNNLDDYPSESFNIVVFVGFTLNWVGGGNYYLVETTVRSELETRLIASVQELGETRLIASVQELGVININFSPMPNALFSQ